MRESLSKGRKKRIIFTCCWNWGQCCKVASPRLMVPNTSIMHTIADTCVEAAGRNHPDFFGGKTFELVITEVSHRYAG